MEFLRQVLAEAADEPACLVTVVRASGSTPRHVGAKMLVFPDGHTIGTIGGGRVELEATLAAKEVAAGQPAHRLRFDLVRDLAMCCGGSMELYLEGVQDSIGVFEDTVECLAARRRAELVTPLNGSGKYLRDPSSASRTPWLEGDALVEPIVPGERAVIFGLGHVSLALGPLLARLNFDVVVCDDNETGAIEADVPWASMVVASFEPNEVAADLGGLGFGDYALVLTRDHAIDQRIVEGLVQIEELTYLGLIGSSRKVASFRRRIIHKGICDEQGWTRVIGPVGIDIAAETPAEIAVSIAAQMIERRNRPRREESCLA